MTVALTLPQKQRLFAKNLGLLLYYAYLNNITVRMGEGYVGDSIDKPREDTPHLRYGNHFNRLAQDLILDVDGQPMWVDHSHWQALGAHWKQLYPMNRWGGDFRARDYGHFSMLHNGVQ